MSTLPASVSTGRRLVTATPVRALVPTLARQEARRLLLQPLVLLGFALWLLNAGLAIVDDGGPRVAFETIDSMISFFPGVFLILAANLLATRDRRADAEHLLAPLPARAQDRTLALMLAALAPALVALGLVLALHGYFLLDGRYHVAPGVWHVLQGPVTVLGASLLGIMLAAWAPARGSAVIAMVALVAGNVWLAGLQHGMLFGPLITWPIWGPFPEAWAGTFEGSPMWHVGYLIGLCGMAAAAALVRVADRRRPVVAFGLLALTTAVLSGIAQLP
jgi:hypothetical protein